MIRLRMAIGRELDAEGIEEASKIAAIFGRPAKEVGKLMSWRQWREGDLALLEAAVARLGVQVADEASGREQQRRLWQPLPQGGPGPSGRDQGFGQRAPGCIAEVAAHRLLIIPSGLDRETDHLAPQCQAAVAEGPGVERPTRRVLSH